MTRINCIPPSELTRQHLVAEYRELPRIFGMVLSMVERGVTLPEQAKIPPTYRMGTGHMKFFCDKLEYLVQRQRALVDEMLKRGYQPKHTDPESLRSIGIPNAWYNSWSPDERAMAISRARIEERLNG